MENCLQIQNSVMCNQKADGSHSLANTFRAIYNLNACYALNLLSSSLLSSSSSEWIEHRSIADALLFSPLSYVIMIVVCLLSSPLSSSTQFWNFDMRKCWHSSVYICELVVVHTMYTIHIHIIKNIHFA